MKNKEDLWTELVVKLASTDALVERSSVAASRIAALADHLITEAEARGYVFAPVSEVQALRQLETVVRKLAEAGGKLDLDDGIEQALAVIGRVRGGS